MMKIGDRVIFLTLPEGGPDYHIVIEGTITSIDDDGREFPVTVVTKKGRELIFTEDELLPYDRKTFSKLKALSDARRASRIAYYKWSRALGKAINAEFEKKKSAPVVSQGAAETKPTRRKKGSRR